MFIHATYCFVCLFVFGATAPNGPGRPHHEVSGSHTDAPQSVALFWTSDQLVAETT
jgi:hypothetical protein